MPLPGVRGALANAVRQVNAQFNRLPKSKQDEIEIGNPELDREIDAAIVAGNRDRALVAITAWRSHWLREFAEVGA